MLISEFDNFVRETDWSKDKAPDQQKEIAVYGLAAEIGSIVAAVKKRLLSDDVVSAFNSPNDEIIEELGDAIWYCFALARIHNEPKTVNILALDIANIKRELSGNSDRAKYIDGLLTPEKKLEFLVAAEAFPKATRKMRFEDYQNIAILTARTKSRELVEVCLGMLWQLASELLLQQNLPASEKYLNKIKADRNLNDILGEIAWHISALASVYSISLGHIADKNVEKISFRIRDKPTPLHDDDSIKDEYLPRRFDVSFVTVASDKSRMYVNGRQVGDDLTDNAYDDDGYRFHDVMHLANAAKLGWSPVLRKLMSRKRKSNKQIDEVEDGARAQIVEEAVIKAIHGEGVRIASQRIGPPVTGPLPLFSNKREITFTFLRFIRNFVSDLEVKSNRYWEWEEAILDGYAIFHQLRQEGQGTVSVDLIERTLKFSPYVFVDNPGKVTGIGVKLEKATSASFFGDKHSNGHAIARQKVIHAAIMASLGIETPTGAQVRMLSITELAPGRVSVKTERPLSELMWSKGVVCFRTAVVETADGLQCTALAISD